MTCLCGRPAVILLDDLPFCIPRLVFGPFADYCALGVCADGHDCSVAQERAA